MRFRSSRPLIRKLSKRCGINSPQKWSYISIPEKPHRPHSRRSKPCGHIGKWGQQFHTRCPQAGPGRARNPPSGPWKVRQSAEPWASEGARDVSGSYRSVGNIGGEHPKSIRHHRRVDHANPVAPQAVSHSLKTRESRHERLSLLLTWNCPSY